MAKIFINIDASALLKPSFTDLDAFMSLVEHFLEELPEYKPHKWNWVEPINKPFSLAIVRSEMEKGVFDFSWKRFSPPKGLGEFGKQAKNKPWHAHHTMFLTASNQNQTIAICQYLKACASGFGVDYAYADSLAEGYKDYGVICNAAPYRSEIMIPPVKLYKNLPDILWFQVFGPPYVRLFGLDKLLSAPAFKVEQLGPEMVYIQLSESLFDMHERYEEVDAVRQKVKAHLDDNIFFRPENPEGHVYQTPDFQFPAKPA